MAVIKQLHEKQASPKTITDYRYQVFLSFRGKDTRLSFTDHLHKALVQADIDTFLDDEEIETGEDLKPDLERAIRQSRASIIVLSKNYASSTWCLDELVMILEEHKNSGMIVLPIFYHVDPSHVRKQHGSFADAIKNYEEDIEGETDLEKKTHRTHKLKLWKEALTKVANLKGKDITGWHETAFIQQIVTEIDGRLGYKISRTSQDFIGRSFQVKDINSWLQDKSVKGIDFLTICGMGGIGKTALAKYVYDENFRLFECSCFLENIGKISTSIIPDGMLGLQKQLLKDIKGQQDISRINEGTTMIEKAFMKKQVLLVLDDVDSVDQLDALLGKKGFLPGSKIIITTKDRLLPKKSEVWNMAYSFRYYTEHLLEGLEINESLELLSRHAFRCDSPKEGYEESSRKAVQYCGGHPLALKVLGSSLFQRDVSAWEDTLKLLEKESNLEIHRVLQISFDSLSSENDKKLFKHIACFFVGKDTDYIEQILKACDIRTSSGIPNLIDKCLLTIDSFKCVEMHQLLQEMGRHIIHQESPTKPWKRSILCCHAESFNVLKEDRGTDKTHGLLLGIQMVEKKFGRYYSTKAENCDYDARENLRTLALLGWFQTFISRFWWLFMWLFHLCSKFRPGKGELQTEAFTKMKNLALLQVNFVKLTGSYGKFPTRLRWLCWHGFPLQYIPLDLPMASLVALDMSHSNLEHLIKLPKSLALLKFLDLNSSVKLRTADFSGLPNLERLILARCSRLVEICESIGELQGLLLLDLSYCAKLKKLPGNMNRMKKIRTLLVEGCSNLFKPLAHESRTMKVVPRSPKSSWLLLPHSIVNLTLSNNDLSNESFPMDFSSLSSLMTLDISGNPIESLPGCVRSLVKIDTLTMWDCKNLKSVLHLPSTITALIVWGCESLEKITLHSAHSRPPYIETSECYDLMEAQGIFKVEATQKILTDRLGWYDIAFLEKQKFVANYTFPPPMIMLYEHGIFSTFSWDDKVPDWFTHKINGPKIYFIVTPSPNNLKIRGLNVCFVQIISDIHSLHFLKTNPPATKVNNMTKNITWTYINHWKGDITVINHLMFQNNELEVGDVICVSIEVDNYCIEVEECGICLVYDEHNDHSEAIKTDPLDYYKSWKRIIGGDISHFMSLTDDNSYLLKTFPIVYPEELDTYTYLEDYVSSLLNPSKFEGTDDSSYLQETSFRKNVVTLKELADCIESTFDPNYKGMRSWRRKDFMDISLVITYKITPRIKIAVLRTRRYKVWTSCVVDKNTRNKKLYSDTSDAKTAFRDKEWWPPLADCIYNS